ncbi:three-Cys-motif partner protein TcmP (plasmid) [Pseudochrobactrum algeriensis]|uniref:three-Cys-motif partner protein TcmP n=1 Tax=Pseudochrobactrum algeriensis TaxID=2834768 RepID=UPI001BD1748B|nr:three-Cys-motif partner protein TcmP [Pseudochrobactrum algeriensis]QVQ35433.1 three-Cys-motif partner protein TcmP [Pseudochrobactrum algeriensis]QVQ42048.1 three-Cys-motif partner protein TcmP [Pseudochrobactrum algeriensis]QVQ42306.1 three-Cys-motif partner protein TcmP [Pseudochrobactrum algeriensis]
MDVYIDREQTAAKHFILKRYLETLAFKLLLGGYSTLTYIDGFSGPWETRTGDHSDSSFMIAIKALKSVQENLRLQGRRHRIKCFFVEQNPTSYAELHATVMQHHDPKNDFHIETFNGRFEDATAQIQSFVRGTFALTFIDPTGWTGYEFAKIKPILEHTPSEVLVNFMFNFINRFTASSDERILKSFDGILGQNWQSRMDVTANRENEILRLFSTEFQQTADFEWVLHTPIEKISDKRTHFYIVYGTRSLKGLETYRNVEYSALKEHGMRRIEAKASKLMEATGQSNLFMAAELSNISFEHQIDTTKKRVTEWLCAELARMGKPIRFGDLWPAILQEHTLRITDVKDICAQLGKSGQIIESWKANKSKRRTPIDSDLIQLSTKNNSNM